KTNHFVPIKYKLTDQIVLKRCRCRLLFETGRHNHENQSGKNSKVIDTRLYSTSTDGTLRVWNIVGVLKSVQIGTSIQSPVQCKYLKTDTSLLELFTSLIYVWQKAPHHSTVTDNPHKYLKFRPKLQEPCNALCRLGYWAGYQQCPLLRHDGRRAPNQQ
uniref:Uncharacterized protein n=1 Tax=Strigamia maritima TaxID=126957 RepID=T1JH12_STRMM